MQLLGETVDAIMADDQKRLDKIVALNKDRNEPYWIVIAAKPGKTVDAQGRFVIRRHFKAHYTEPRQLVGVMIAKVDNQKGTMEWDVNIPDIPFDFGLLGGEVAGASEIKSKIKPAYVYE